MKQSAKDNAELVRGLDASVARLALRLDALSLEIDRFKVNGDDAQHVAAQRAMEAGPVPR